MELRNENPTNFIFYQSTDGKVNVQVIVDEQSETVWATQKTLGELFGVSKSTISEHTKNIFETKELDRESTVRKIRTVQEEELSELNRVVTMYLDFAENMARRQLSMRMADWVNRLDAFLSFNQYEVLQDSGRVSAIEAKLKAETEFDQFRVIQDQRYESDFDRMVKEMGRKGKN